MPNSLISKEDHQFMKMACDLAIENHNRGGEPFGAVIVKNGQVIAAACNSVALDNDPTAHAEINAIRCACSMTHNHKLDGCVVYSSCEPCPMCLSALYLAGVSRIYYANTATDVGNINFSSNFIYKEIEEPHLDRSIPCIHMQDTDAIKSFNKLASKEDKIEY